MAKNGRRNGKAEVPTHPALKDYVVQSGVNPGFEAVPWTPRTEMGPNGNIGKYTPRHLMVYSDAERTEAHYPNASRNSKGEIDRWCWACGRPCGTDGLSAKGHKGCGKPCPACGFRRKIRQSQKALASLRPAGTPEGEAQLGAVRGSRLGKRTPKVTELMREMAEREAEKIMAPYFEGLELQPKGEWSPSTKLEFYLNQTQIAEKLMDRVEGKPVMRNRHVTAEDDDVLRDDELSASTLVQLVAAAATGADLTQVVDGEWEEVPAANEGADGGERL